MASVSNIISRSGQYEGIVQQLVQLESQKKVQYQTDLRDQNKINSELGKVSSRISTLENMIKEYSLSTNNTFTPVKSTSSDDTVVEITSASNLDNPDEFSLTISRLATRDNLLSASYTSTGTNLDSNGSVDITVDGTTHTISITPTAGDSNSTVLNSLKSAIESAFGETLQVNVFDLDSTNVQLSVRSSETGEAKRVQIANTSGSLATVFDNATRPVATNQLDAAFTMNGVSFQRSSNTINDTISGLTFELKKTSASAVTLEIERDTDKARSNFDDFVKAYNDLNTDIRNKTFINGETGARGPLRELRSIRDLSSQLRQLVIGDATSGTITNLSQLGISFDNSGKMTVEDSDKLDTVLANTPSDLNTFFSTSSSPIQSIYTHLQGYTSTDGIIDTLEDGVSDKIELLNKNIEKEEKYLADYEEKQRDIFTQLELMLEQGNSQFAQVMAGLNNF
jgi:flagellar hook-associated protein 2